MRRSSYSTINEMRWAMTATRPKSEDRRPKTEGIPKPEDRKLVPAWPCRISDFVFRPSDFHPSRLRVFAVNPLRRRRGQGHLPGPHPSPGRGQLLQVPQRGQEEGRPRPDELPGRPQGQRFRRRAGLGQPGRQQAVEGHHARRRPDHAAQPAQAGGQGAGGLQEMDSGRPARNCRRQGHRG